MNSADSKAAILRALRLLDIFRDMDQNMPMGEAVSLLLIGYGETPDGGGLSVTELSKKGNFALSSASRYMKSLGKKDRHGREGEEVVSEMRDPTSDRQKILRLTPKGRRVIEEVQRVITGAK